MMIFFLINLQRFNFLLVFQANSFIYSINICELHPEAKHCKWVDNSELDMKYQIFMEYLVKEERFLIPSYLQIICF